MTINQWMQANPFTTTAAGGGALTVLSFAGWVVKKIWDKLPLLLAKKMDTPGTAGRCLENSEKLTRLDERTLEHSKELDEGKAAFKGVMDDVKSMSSDLAVIMDRTERLDNIRSDMIGMRDELQGVQIGIIKTQSELSLRGDNLRLTVEQFSESLRAIQK